MTINTMIKNLKKVESATRLDAFPFGIEYHLILTDVKEVKTKWYATYTEREEAFVTMYNNWRQLLPVIVNNNGMDNASCPKCNRYNAMLADSYNAMPTDSKFVCTCRDCGFQCLVEIT